VNVDCAQVIGVTWGLDSPWPDRPRLDWLLADLVRLQVPCASLEYVSPDVDRLAARLRPPAPSVLQVVVGGLGPEGHNVTRPAIARALGRALRREPSLEAHLRDFYGRRQVRVPASAWCQADGVDGLQVLLDPDNPVAGWRVHSADRLLVALPAEPDTAGRLWAQHVRPLLQGSAPVLAYHRRVLKLVGLPEAEVRRRLGPVLDTSNPRVQVVEAGAEVHLRLVATAPWNARARGRLLRLQPGVDPIRLRRGPAAAAEELTDMFEHRVRALLPYHLYGADDEPLGRVVGTLLCQGGARLAIADAVTLGAVSAAFAAEERAALAGATTGSCGHLLADDGDPTRPESPEATVKHLAAGVRAHFGAEVGLAVLPRAGPGVWLAADNHGRVRLEEHTWRADEVFERAVPFALNLVRKVLLPALECC
jgi:nicotinamide-nucleotide amidase